MQIESINMVSRLEARDLYRKYRTHQHYQQPIDWAIQRSFQLIAQGRVVIRAIESIRNAGLNEDKLPKLAMVRADAEYCYWRPGYHGGGVFCREGSWKAEKLKDSIHILDGTWAEQARGEHQYRALTPLVPIYLRPKRALQAYYVLFEAEWTTTIPIDPLLVRRIGTGDFWVVCAAWNLTPVEQAALAARL